MESPKTNKLAMYRATAALLATIATLPEFTRLQPRRAAFLAKLEEIAALEAQHAEPLGSSLLERDRALEAMIDAILALASAARSQADAMLANQLDPLILPLRKTNPDFYARYQALCEVVARPGGRNTPSPRKPRFLSPVTTAAAPPAEERKVA